MQKKQPSEPGAKKKSNGRGNQEMSDDTPRFPSVIVPLLAGDDVFGVINRTCRMLREAQISPDIIETYRNSAMRSAYFPTVLKLTRQVVIVDEATP